jgi:cytochrome oxidase Cu insertion factor (SCO1/SenC/PrrC family)
MTAEADGSLRRALLWGLLVAVMLAVLVTAVMAPNWRGVESHDGPPKFGEAPAFRLTNRDGREIDSADLRGSAWIADFIFTRCALSCPRMTERMLRLEAMVGDGLRRVSFSVDPEYDSPEVLQLYADSWGITDPDWLFLTGDREAMRRLVTEGFKLGLDDAPPTGTASPDEPILHSTRFVLVDGTGVVRGYYDAFNSEDFNGLVRDFQAVVAEPSNRSVTDLGN